MSVFQVIFVNYPPTHPPPPTPTLKKEKRKKNLPKLIPCLDLLSSLDPLKYLNACFEAFRILLEYLEHIIVAIVI